MHDKVAKEIQNKHYFISPLKEIDHKFTDLLPKHYQQFSDSWNNLDIDLYMSDKGKYRYRRYSVINWRNNGDLEYLAPEPHFQKKTYNSLHGDIYRHYSPFEDKTLKNPLLKALIDCSSTVFCQLKNTQQDWRVECHQFRIVPSRDEKGLPTPEGKHRDGVEYVFMMLVNRHNIEGGVTKIYNSVGQPLSTHLMENPWECIFIDDSMTMHEVSPVYKLTNNSESYRDMLVLTFQKS